jgi:hypothetical protein
MEFINHHSLFTPYVNYRCVQGNSLSSEPYVSCYENYVKIILQICINKSTTPLTYESPLVNDFETFLKKFNDNFKNLDKVCTLTNAMDDIKQRTPMYIIKHTFGF